MERIHHLVHQLQEQLDDHAAPAQLLLTTQLLEAELSSLCSRPAAAGKSTKVAVVMPSLSKKIFEHERYMPASEPVAVIDEPVPVAKVQDLKSSPVFDPIREIPTLSQQEKGKEINDVIGLNGTSLNEKLKDNVVELAASLKEAPVRELKKAIGINDRYVFIKELFRGDEAMYERSIKTINNFRILPEAEYWMERELKVKIGWDDNSAPVQHFYSLVKRRFS